ncbi:MAG TPA: outer membrane beta-barrel protein [Xanthobacteraceae bacterium]|jgi:opacity protein-like surface antigen
MHKSLMLIATLAALPVVAAVAARPANAAAPSLGIYSWTGFYIGGEAGWSWATQQITHVTGATAFPAGSVDTPLDQNGPLGGIYAGYNYQMSQFLAGIDGDIMTTDMTGTGRDVSPVNGDAALHSDQINWIATATGRVGYFSNNWLLFAKAGWAWAPFGESNILRTHGGGLVNTSTSSATRNGWTAGAGLEWGFAAHWSAKLEYDYIGFATANYLSMVTSAAGAVSAETRSATSSLSMLKAGVGFRF